MTDIEPVTIYGSSISYFTGKVENYFRVKGIAYELKPMTAGRIAPQVKEATGTTQVPAIKLADGRWMTDSTPIIQWFEVNHSAPTLLPEDPLQRFFCLLIEDYADEWLWRPAMHYRWHYDLGARFASTHLAAELGADISAPEFLKRRRITRRQRDGYTTGDGITPEAVKGVEAIYLRTLQQLEDIFRTRPFLLGERPTLADIGFSGPFFRHFALDPVPAEIMRQTAPAVWNWVTGLWCARLDTLQSASLVDGIPDDWGPILDEIGTHYLPYLHANVAAVKAQQRRFDTTVGGIHYRQARWSPYRVWCLQQLRAHFLSLADTEQAKAKRLLEQHGCWAPLWEDEDLPIAEDFCDDLPFRADAKMIDVYQ